MIITLKLTWNGKTVIFQLWENHHLIAAHLETARPADATSHVDVANYSNVLGKCRRTAGIASSAAIFNVDLDLGNFCNFLKLFKKSRKLNSTLAFHSYLETEPDVAFESL